MEPSTVCDIIMEEQPDPNFNKTNEKHSNSNLDIILEILRKSHPVSKNKLEILEMFKSIKGHELTLTQLNYIIRKNTSAIKSVRKGEYVCADV